MGVITSVNLMLTGEGRESSLRLWPDHITQTALHSLPPQKHLLHLVPCAPTHSVLSKAGPHVMEGLSLLTRDVIIRGI